MYFIHLDIYKYFISNVCLHTYICTHANICVHLPRTHSHSLICTHSSSLFLKKMPPFNKHWNWFQVLQDFRVIEKGNLHLSLHMKKNQDFTTKLK